MVSTEVQAQVRPSWLTKVLNATIFPLACSYRTHDPCFYIVLRYCTPAADEVPLFSRSFNVGQEMLEKHRHDCRQRWKSRIVDKWGPSGGDVS